MLNLVCMNFTYDPMEFAILWDMNLNENSIYGDSVSGRNPVSFSIGFTFLNHS